MNNHIVDRPLISELVFTPELVDDFIATNCAWCAGDQQLEQFKIARRQMLGYGGNFSTRSRAYSVTLRTLRKARKDWRSSAWHRTADQLADDDTTTIATQLGYAGIGWHTTGDAALANAAAARARERRLTARDEIRSI